MTTVHEGTEVDVASTLYAVVRHMKDYSLPIPASIDTDAEVVSLFVLAPGVDAWLDAMIVDHESVTACASDLPVLANYERVLFRGRVITAAHGAIAFQLRTVRPATTTLRSVPA